MSHRDLTQVGKYQIVELIGEGAMGAVYRAVDPVLIRSVAIKVMADPIAREPELRDRFLREAQAAGSLQHPNVVTIYDFGEVDGHPFIAMEYVEGADLEAILARHEPLTLQAKLDIAVDVLAGLAYAHKHGVVHRDIKPANIRITTDGRAKLMDFGIAQLSSSSMTKTGVMMGTPNYMAPEQVMGEKTSPATDIFAFGAVLFELLTGCRPFQGATLHNILFKIVSEDTPSVQALLPGLPAALDHVVRKALAKDPKDRFATALDMANELTVVRASLSGDPSASTLSLRASIASTMASQRKAPRFGRRAWAAWAGAAGAVVVVGIVASWLAHTGARRGTPSVAPATQAETAPAVVAVTPPTLSPAPTPETVRTPVAAPPHSPPHVVNRRRPDHPPATPQPATPPAAPLSERALESVRALQTSALQARQRAIAAGATAGQLAEGDAQNAPVEALIAQGALAEAAARLTAASTMWLNAERSVRAAASTSATPPRAAEPAAGAPAPAPPPPPPAPATPAQPAASPAAEISALIAGYARAISSRDVSKLRRAYPGLTADQQRGFEQFFQSVRSVRADFTVSDLDVNGATAEARVSGIYDFVGSDGKSERQPITFRATFKRDGGTWRLMAVR